MAIVILPGVGFPDPIEFVAQGPAGVAVFFAVISKDLGPGIAQTDRAIEHRLARRRIQVAIEIALPLKLKVTPGQGICHAWLDARAFNHFKRVRI